MHGGPCTSTCVHIHTVARHRRPRDGCAPPRHRPHGQLREAAVERRRRTLALRHPHGSLPRRLRGRAARAGRLPPRTRRDRCRRVLPRLPPRLPRWLLQPRDRAGPRAVGEGHGQVPAALPLPRHGPRVPGEEGRALLLAHPGGVLRRPVPERLLRRRPASLRRGGRLQPRRGGTAARHGRRERDQRLRRGRGRGRVSAERAHWRPEPPRHRARRGSPAADADLPAPRASAPAPAAARARPVVPARRRARDSLPQRSARARVRGARAGRAVQAQACVDGAARAARPRHGPRRRRGRGAVELLRGRAPVENRHGRGRDVDPLRRLRLRPGRAVEQPAVRARAEQLLGVLRVRHRPDELRAALVLRRVARRDRARRRARVRGIPRPTSSDAPGRRGASAGRLPPRESRSQRGYGRSGGASPRHSSRRSSRTSST